MNYLLSLKKTFPSDQYMTFWAPNDAGYRQAKSQLGEYPETKTGYDPKASIPVPVKSCEHMFEEVPGVGFVVPNDEFSRDFFGIEEDHEGQYNYKFNPKKHGHVVQKRVMNQITNEEISKAFGKKTQL